MKQKLITYFLLFSIACVYAQSNLKDESKLIADEFINSRNYKVVRANYADTIHKLVFKGYKKFNESDLSNVKVIRPTYLILDNKTKPGKEVNQKLRKKLEFTDLKFDFNTTNSILMINTNKALINNKDNMFVKALSVKDLVMLEFSEENTDKSYYFFKFDSYNEYYVFSSKELLEKEKEKNNKVTAAKFVEFRLDQTKNKAQNIWGDGYFSKVFPDGKVYYYDVEYEVFYKSGNIKLKSNAITNIKYENLSLKDFPSNESYKPISFSINDSLNIYQLLLNETAIRDSVLVNKESNERAYRFWDDYDFKDIHISYRDEARLIKKNTLNYSKFDSIYFKNKLKDSIYWKKFPSFLTSKVKEESLVTPNLEFSFQDKKHSFYRPAVMIYVKTNENKVTFCQKIRRYQMKNYEVDMVFTNKEFCLEYDLRVDTPNFNFLYVDPGLLTGLDYGRTLIQPEANVDVLKEENVRFSVEKINGYYNYLQEKQKEQNYNLRARQKLYTKYGKKYVDEALNGNVIIGMPLELAQIPLRLWVFKKRTTFNDYITLYFESAMDSSRKLAITVKNEKVTNVSSW